MEPESESAGPGSDEAMSQLQRLQNQQVARFIDNVRQRRKREACIQKDNPMVNHQNGITDTDNLELKTNMQCLGWEGDLVKTDSVSEMGDLQKQIKQLQFHNDQLVSQLKGKEDELVSTRNQLEEERAALSGTGSSMLATQKIVDLSRKNRELQAELATERNRSRQLRSRLQEVAKSGKQQEQIPEEERAPSDVALQQHREQVSQLEQQLAQSQQKMTDYRNQCQLLQQDLKLAHKVLSKEVGEGVSISSLLSATGSKGWKGRAQQIITLQNKVSELHRQLQAVNQGEKGHTTISLVGSGGTAASERHKASITRIEADRRRNMEELRQELHQLQADYSQLKQQHSALKARNKTLTSDSKELRSQITSLLPTLREKEAAREREGADVKGKEKRIDPRLQREVERLRGENDSLSAQLFQRASEIISLKKALQEPHSQMSSRSDHHASHSLSPVSSSPATSISSHSTLSGPLSVTVSKGRDSLPPVPPSCTRQPMSRRGKGTQVPHSTALMRQSVSAGHVPVSHSDISLEEAVTVMRVTEVEKDKLSELNQLLKQRLDCATERVLRAETELCSVRQQNAILERQLGRMGTGRVTCSDGKLEKQHDQLLVRLSIQEDENRVLKEMLDLVREEKEQDLKLMSSLLGETRRTFSETMSRLRVS